MTEEIISCNEQPIEKSIKPSSSLAKVLLWLVTILFVPQILLFFAWGIYFGVQGLSQEAIDAKLTSVLMLLMMALVAPILTIPLLNAATQANNWKERFEFWALKSITAKTLITWSGLGLIFWIVSSFLGEWLNIPVEQFMLDVKAASDSAIGMTLVIVTICIVVPIMEELVFRGWLYSKIAQTKLGNIGALILSSIIFTIIHTQYDNIITLFIILSLGLLLGFARYKTNNISYSIAIHILFNSLATITLFFFL
jgi:membrane protease YdiL (CAAX protease family)